MDLAPLTPCGELRHYMRRTMRLCLELSSPTVRLESQFLAFRESPDTFLCLGYIFLVPKLYLYPQHNRIAFKRKDYQFKLAHKLCDMAETIFVEDCDFRIMAKGMLGKHSIDASFGQFRTILEYVGQKRDVFVGQVDHRGTSQTCPNCRSSVRKDLSVRMHRCNECGYVVDRDIASAQEICNRGTETYRGTPEKHSYWLSSRTVGQLGCR